jgi:hypothetical protein
MVQLSQPCVSAMIEIARGLVAALLIAAALWLSTVRVGRNTYADVVSLYRSFPDIGHS